MKCYYQKESRILRIGKVFYWRGRTLSGAPRCFGNDRVGFLHAHKDGVPVLRGEASWRTICGLYVNVFGGFFALQVRRHWQ